MTRYLIVGILFLLAWYGLMEAWPLLAGPSLSIASPQDHTPFPGGTVTISGASSRIATLTLDGATLPHDEHGNFSSVLTFPSGGSILTFIATDRFARSLTTTRTIFVP